MVVSSCPGPLSRRALLRLGALALGGLYWPHLLSAQPASRSISVILFWMWGGPSQFETFDPLSGSPRPSGSAVPSLEYRRRMT